MINKNKSKIKHKSRFRFLHVLSACFLLTVTLFSAGAGLSPQEGKELLEKAKLNLFDRKWKPALESLEALLDEHPDSSIYPLALFYKGKCLVELKEYEDALEIYDEYLKLSKNQSLREEAMVATIDLNFRLHEGGGSGYMERIGEFLGNRNKTVRYYAAFKLSYAGDKEAAEAAVPLLKQIAGNESDQELVDRAKLALMRINPRHLKSSPVKNAPKKRIKDPHSLHIHVFNKQTKEKPFSITLPIALAMLGLESLPEKDKKELEMEGYNLDKIMKNILNSGEVFRLETEEMVFKIWLE